MVKKVARLLNQKRDGAVPLTRLTWPGTDTWSRSTRRCTIEAFCHFKSCHLFNMADVSPRFLAVLKNENTGGITLHVEWMSRVSQDQLLHLQEERDMVWRLLGLVGASAAGQQARGQQPRR